MLPTFIGIGAQRAGTTWAYNCLAEHPQVFMTAKKELHFFYAHYDRGLAWYEEQFAGAGAAKASGEISPDYMYNTDALDNIARDLPDVKLFAILRNPIDRAISAYALRHERNEGMSFGEAISFSAARMLMTPRPLPSVWIRSSRFNAGSPKKRSPPCCSIVRRPRWIAPIDAADTLP